MKYIITESKLLDISLHWLNKHFNPDKLDKVKHSHSIFYKKNGKIVMIQDLWNKILIIDYDSIWSFFSSFFGLKDREIEDLLLLWLKQDLELNGYTADWDFLT